MVVRVVITCDIVAFLAGLEAFLPSHGRTDAGQAGGKEAAQKIA